MIKIVTDSTCDLPKELFAKHHITVVPLSIHFGQETFRDGVTIDKPMLYERLYRDGLVPTTSQPSAGEFAEVYRELAREGDSILSLHISRKLSGTCQAAEIARSMLPDLDIQVFDTQSVSAGIGFMVLEAARKAEAGWSMADILGYLSGLRKNVHLVFTPATLKYLELSGRVNHFQSFTASLLDIKPLIFLREGGLEPLEKVRTRKKALSRLIEVTAELQKEAKALSLAVIHAHAAEEAEALMAQVREAFPSGETFIVDLTSTLVVHGGPGVVG
ncbi:MAG TPA: DegV family protein, partial [Dehalococcoidia bacterium]|nr:DegV family protein [Dehalococcoidia bacterium]